MKSLGYASLGMTFANSLNMLINTDLYARGITTGTADTTLLGFAIILIVFLGAIYYFVISNAGKI